MSRLDRACDAIRLGRIAAVYLFFDKLL